VKPYHKQGRPPTNFNIVRSLGAFNCVRRSARSRGCPKTSGFVVDVLLTGEMQLPTPEVLRHELGGSIFQRFGQMRRLDSRAAGEVCDRACYP
jgi:hypothetical protein